MARNENVREKPSKTVMASKRGQARAAALTPQQRSESARKAVRARWEKERAASSISVFSTSTRPAGTMRITVEATRVYHDTDPHITPGGTSWSVNSPSSVIMLNKTTSYTQ